MAGSDVLIIGAGGHGAELYSYLRDLSAQGDGVRFLGFVDEGKPKGRHGGVEVLGGLEDLKRLLDARGGTPLHYVTAVGDNSARQQLVARVEALGRPNLIPWTLRHPAASVGHDVQLGEGTCLAPGSIVTTRARIGKHCILNVNASVSHDCMVGDYANINPGAAIAGWARIGEGCFIGAGATVIDRVSVGAWAVIGAGAVVVRDIPDRVTAVGVPARVIKRHSA
jgi:sugar O-acyltransferase (sialic acid O-acetyltransferase NeuD family)